MYDGAEELPRRVFGSHLPPAAYRVVGRAKVANGDEQWHDDDRTLYMLLDALREWEVVTR